MSSMTLPYQEPLVPREPGPRQIPEPPRRGEPGGPPCAICGGKTTSAVWSDDNWTLHPPVGGSLPGRSGSRAASTSTPSPTCRRSCRPISAALRRGSSARSSTLGDIARVHLYRWGDGGAHFHVWFLPRPLGMLEASGMALPVWEDVLPNVPDEELRAAAERVAAAM